MAGLTLCCAFAGAQAQQRTCDMAVTLVSPVEGAVVNAYASYNITVSIKNNGPSDLVAGDTLYYNTPSMFALATAPYVLQAGIPSGGSTTLTLATAVNNNENTEDVTGPYCVKVLSHPQHTGGFIDTASIANNTDCHNVTFKAVGPTGIEDLSENRGNLKLYPNPVTGYLNLDLKGYDLTEATVILRDMTGRVLLQQTYGKLPVNTEHLRLELPALAPGQYLAELYSDRGRFTGRFVK